MLSAVSARQMAIEVYVSGFRRYGLPCAVNYEDRKEFPIKGSGRTVWPDAVLFEAGGDGYGEDCPDLAVFFVPEDEVTEDAVRNWAVCAAEGYDVLVHVPAGQADFARRLCEQAGAGEVSLGEWTLDGEILSFDADEE